MKKSHIILVVLVLTAILVAARVWAETTGGGEKVIERYSDGQKKSEGYMLDDGSKVGDWTYWHENGHLHGEGEFKDGKEEGSWTWWHNNGRKKGEGEFKDGKKEGSWT